MDPGAATVGIPLVADRIVKTFGATAVAHVAAHQITAAHEILAAVEAMVATVSTAGMATGGTLMMTMFETTIGRL